MDLSVAQVDLIARAVTDATSPPSQNTIRDTIRQLSSLYTRKVGTRDGEKASQLVQDLFIDAGAGQYFVEQVAPVVAYPYGKPFIPQSSVVCSIPGTPGCEETVILGCHLDSSAGRKDRAPGADDDASGVAAIVVAIKAIATHRIRFRRSIEFHAYAAEERQLHGSKCVVHMGTTGCGKKPGQKYSAPNVDGIAAMIQADMVGFQGERGLLPTIFFYNQGVDLDLTEFLVRLSRCYLSGVAQVAHVPPGPLGALSDHLIWGQQGVPTAFLCEDPHHYNKLVHTPDDTLAELNALDQTAACSGLMVAAAGHIGGAL